MPISAKLLRRGASVARATPSKAVAAILVVVGLPFLFVALIVTAVADGVGIVDRRGRVPVAGRIGAGVLVVLLIGAIGSTSPRTTANPSAESASPSPVSIVQAATPTVGPPSASQPEASASPTLEPSLAPEAMPTAVASSDLGAAAAGRLSGEPDPVLTPGALNPAVTQTTIRTTICVSGWTATIRPPSSYTTALKIQQIAQYGYGDPSTAAYEEDHLIPLELGGAPRDPHNLWPEPYAATLPDGRDVGARVKDALETSLKRAVCAGTVTLAVAQAEIGDHWVHLNFGIPLGTSPVVPLPTAVPTAATTPLPVVPPPAALSVRFVSLPAPAIPGSTASMSAKTSPGAVCSAKVTWPSGTVSAAAGLKATPAAGSDGLVSWTWNVGSTTKPGTAKAAVTCTLGGSITAVATFTVQ